MEFGVFHEFPALMGRPDSDAFEEAFDIVDGAERWGLDVMWLAELHFDAPRSVLSSPMCIASAIATRTKRMKIGVAVQVLPLGNPLRIAEEAATVDHLSHGRLIFGAGRSGVAKTYEAYNIPYSESKERFNETLDIVRRAWTETNFSHSGKYFNFEDVTVTPRPFQSPMPPIRVAATSPDTFVSIGELGMPIFVAIRHEDARRFAPQIAAYRTAWKGACFCARQVSSRRPRQRRRHGTRSVCWITFAPRAISPRTRPVDWALNQPIRGSRRRKVWRQ
jgi:alkanesulfonate monooxygenase SsuD/methylene tetrahydromethanopterin reductase-like flavin-dependent oxidoreductase (luciferase family)